MVSFGPSTVKFSDCNICMKIFCRFQHWQVPLSKRFRALKLWFVIRNYGISGLQKHVREVAAGSSDLIVLLTFRNHVCDFLSERAPRPEVRGARPGGSQIRSAVRKAPGDGGFQAEGRQCPDGEAPEEAERPR